MRTDLFSLSIDRKSTYGRFLSKRLEFEKFVTFNGAKKLPIYNWFYYKEAFSPQLIWNYLKELKIPKRSIVLDPFCGAGTALLACNQIGYNAVGFDILPLSVFVSNTKLQRDYDMNLLREKIKEITSYKFGETELEWTDPGIVSIKKAFSRYARNDLLFFKEKIMQIEDEKIRSFMFLALLSIAVRASNVKRDGGVLKIKKKRNLAPVRYLFKNKLKRMYKDLKNSEKISEGIDAYAQVGDARTLHLESEFGFCITSPPYLNWIDYTKLYAIELALFEDSYSEIHKLRRQSFRSHVGAEYRLKKKLKSDSVMKIMEKLDTRKVKKPEIVQGYFEDLYLSIESIHNALEDGGKSAIVIGNACLPGITVDSDIILAELAEKIGFTLKRIDVAKVRWCDVHGIEKERPVRESVVILEK
ncbi:MAG TPA: hypothetical protein EYP86_00860 [Candidatus Altiarchaeales archaeon]|nr:hypothetical protein [Candidatus Altiarchaeales archaeon]